MNKWRLSCLALAMTCGHLMAASTDASDTGSAVHVSEGTLEIPTYEHIGREMEPPLFNSSSVKGLYPFTIYLSPFRPGDPKPETYKTVVMENEYLKLTYIPEMGGHIFSLYDKIRKREVFYRNDVLKPTMFNPRLSWPVTGIELTGPYDAHMLTLHSEPFWSHTIVNHPDGSVSLVLGEIDPVYHMKVNLTATLYPGVAAMQISVFCYNRNDGQMPQMFWTNAEVPSTEKTRLIYPMTRTVGHTTGEVSSWPMYNGIDYSWDRNNKHMLGVFGIDSYDNFAGAYQFETDYGVFRYADRRVVQGMKMWTFGYSPAASQIQETYTDHAGPYIEVQSGRYVWDGHYEWMAPHQVESWNEWWLPVAGIGGVTTLTRYVALNLEVKPDPAGNHSEIHVALSPSVRLLGAHLSVSAESGELLTTTVDLVPGTPVAKSIGSVKVDASGLKRLTVRIVSADSREILHYVRPDEDPGRKEYSAFAKALESPQKSPDQMSVEELVEAAEFKLKETDPAAMLDLVSQALKRDPGYSRAHLLLGIHDYTSGQYQKAIEELTAATERDPYLEKAWYYLSMSQLAVGESAKAERNLYYVEPDSAYFGNREYQLGRLAMLAHQQNEAVTHLERAVAASGYDLNARVLLALVLREQGNKTEAMRQLDELTRLDATNSYAFAERYFLNSEAGAKKELLRLMGGQSQQAFEIAALYADVHRWREAVAVLRMVEEDNHDPWGTPPLFYYTLAYDLEQAGDPPAALNRHKAQTAKSNVDRFPYRRESEAPLAAAVKADPHDTVARFNLACLLYFLDRPEEAIAQWRESAVLNPQDFSARRELGLALAEQGKTNEAAAELEKAVELKPEHVRTLNDLSSIYARAGRFDDQIALLTRAVKRTPDDDDLVMALLNAYLIKGRYKDADEIVRTHTFAPRHRSTILRDEYRSLRYGMGAADFNRGDYAGALAEFQAALKPPVSLGVDDFQFVSTPRAYYYIGRTLEAMGRKQDADAAYNESIRGVDLLSGDRDSWNSDNFFAVLALQRLGQDEKARSLTSHFKGFAETEKDDANPIHRGEARYLLALIAKEQGNTAQARTLMHDALEALPDSLPPRFELRGDVIDPLSDVATR